MKRILQVLIALIVVGVAFLFIIKIPAVGLSSNEFCASCHVMEPQYESFQHSAHSLAGNTCSDCHMPHSLGYGALAKAFFGMKDFIGVVRDHDPYKIHATDLMKDITHNNCLRCHGSMMEDVGDPHYNSDRRCFDCHRNTPHETYPNSMPQDYSLLEHARFEVPEETQSLEVTQESQDQLAAMAGLGENA